MEEVVINPTIELSELTQDWEIVLWRAQEGTNRTLYAPGPKKGAVTPQETDPDLSVSVQESLAEAWVNSGLLKVWGH